MTCSDVFRKPKYGPQEWIEILYAGEAVRKVDVISSAEMPLFMKHHDHTMSRGASVEDTFLLYGLKTEASGIENPANDENREYVYATDGAYFRIMPAKLQERGIDGVPAWLRVRIH